MVQSVIYPSIRRCENDANSCNNHLGDSAFEQSFLKRQKFLARKIHKIKKILKLRSKSTAMSKELSLEERQNLENERLYKKLDAGCPCEVEENSINENWENWDACQMCAGAKNEMHTFDYDDHDQRFSCQQPPMPMPTAAQSICYVFMPDQSEPVAVKLRTARIPGGVLCVSYRPDVDIRNSNHVYSYTSFQQPQAQQALRPIMV